MRRKSRISVQGHVIRWLLLIGFLCMEFPGVLFFKDIAGPRIFGLPFAYGFMILGWIYMCVILFWAYKVNWGEIKDTGAEENRGGESK
ncbi:MAG: hypothetical protein PUC26_01270 [Eubacteriales bacterium]|nr:hypothetical protein [Eubacteriales bacterium]